MAHCLNFAPGLLAFFSPSMLLQRRISLFPFKASEIQNSQKKSSHPRNLDVLSSFSDFLPAHTGDCEPFVNTTFKLFWICCHFSHLDSAHAPTPLQHLPSVHLSAFFSAFFCAPTSLLRSGKRVEVIGPAYTHRKRKAKTHAHLRCGLHCVSRPNARVTQRLRITPLKIISAQGMNSFFFFFNGNNVFNLDQPVRSASRITASRATGV